MLRGRFRKGLLRAPPAKRPFGESSRWGDLRADLRTKLLVSGSVERFRQKESRGNWPLVVAADTGLTSGEGVIAAMIGGRTGGDGGWLHSERCGVQPRYRGRGAGAEAAGATRRWAKGRSRRSAGGTGGQQRVISPPGRASASSTRRANRHCEMREANAGMTWGVQHSTRCSTIKNGANDGCRGGEWTAEADTPP